MSVELRFLSSNSLEIDLVIAQHRWMLGRQMKIENRLVIRTVPHVATRGGGEWGWLRDGVLANSNKNNALREYLQGGFATFY